MSAPAAPQAPAAPAKKGKKLIVLVAVGLVCSAAGAAVPMVVDLPGIAKGADKEDGHGKGKGKGKADEQHVAVPFGDVTVNLADERMQRYVRLKVAILVDAAAEKEVTDLLAKHKAVVKSKFIGHIAGKSLKDVAGSVGVARLQRELLEKIEDVLYPDGGGPLKGVLFEEYVVS